VRMREVAAKMAMLKSKVKSFVTRLQVCFDALTCLNKLNAVKVSVPVFMMFAPKPTNPRWDNGTHILVPLDAHYWLRILHYFAALC